MKYLIILTSLIPAAHAAITVNLPGNTTHAEWSDINSTNHPAPPFPGFFNFTDPWPNGIAANAGSDGAASLNKLAGGGFPSSTSIYSFTAPGTFELSQSSPAAGIATVVWQIDHSVAFLVNPVLNYNGGNQALAADFTSSEAGDFSGNGPTGPFTTTLDAYQWDLSGVAGPITDYQIVWTGGEHQSIFTMGLDEGDSFAQVIPEPSTLLLSLGGLLLCLRRRR